MDKVERLGQSLIHHGQDNNRVYLLKLHPDDLQTITADLDQLAADEGYSKIIAKVPEGEKPAFDAAGYRQEATIPGFFKGREEVAFMAKYFDDQRSQVNQEEMDALAGWLNAGVNESTSILDERFRISRMAAEDCTQMADLYRQVFESYPFPIFDPAYLEETIREEQVIYFGVFDGEELVGMSSAELDAKNRNAEMTDFAVLPAYRGNRLAIFLLQRMEAEMAAEGYRILYTICRLISPGMNKTFINSAYHYGGTLVNNTQIAGRIENMNVFFKNI